MDMELAELKKRIADYKNGVIYDDDPNYVSLLVIERYYKKKFQEYLDKTVEFIRYLDQAVDFTKYLQRSVKIDIEQVVPERNYDNSLYLEIKGTEKNNKIFPRKKENSHDHYIQIDFKSLTTRWKIDDYYSSPLDSTNMFTDDSVVREYIDYLTKFIETYDMCCLRRPSSAGLFVDMYFDTSSRVFVINISDRSSTAVSMPYPFGTRDTDNSKDKDKSCNFYYFSYVIEND